VAQGAIVLRQVELMRGALREVGEAVSSSLDLDEVLEQIVSNAVRLTGTDGGSIMEYDEQDESFLVRTAYGSSRALLEQLRAITIRRASTLVGRTVLARRPLEVPDLGQVELDPHLDAPREAERALQEGPVVG
jgi:GAF domain-containing protein